MGRFSRLEIDQPDDSGKTPAGLDLDRLQPPPGAREEETVDAGPAACIRLGDEALFRANPRGALRWYSRAIDQDSTNIEAWVHMLRVLLLKGDLHDARTWIERGLTLHPESPHLLALRAVLHARRGMLRQAINSSDAILEQAADLPLAYLARGEVLLLADNKNADYCFEQCLKLSSPTDYKNPFFIALVLEERRLWASAMNYLRTAAQRNEHYAPIWYHVGLCRARLGHAQQAQRAFAQARELCGGDDPLIVKIDQARPGSIWNRLVSFFARR